MIEIRIKQAALARGIENPSQLADKVGCAPKIIWESWHGLHYPKLPLLDRICEALKCDLHELIVRRPNPRSANGHGSATPQKRTKKPSVRRGSKAAKLSDSE